MRLLEGESKLALASKGVPIPKGELAYTPEEAAEIVRKLGGRGVLKIQIPHGQRGKAGGIKLVNSPEEALEVAKELFSKTFYGYRPESLLVEEPVEALTEIYVGGIVDRESRSMTFLTSPYGGMDVEEVAAQHPESIVKASVEPLIGMVPYIARKLAKNASKNFPDKLKEIQSVIMSLWKVAEEYDAMMIEINPLVITKDGKVLALDARIEVDDNALYRHKEFEKKIYEKENPRESEAAKLGVAYVELGGNIGTMANGAGLAMATMDLVKFAGGEPANFCDVGGGASADQVANALRIILKNPNVKVVLINTLCGITSCVDVANGVKKVYEEGLIKVPIVVRMSGNRASEGKEILASIGVKATEKAMEAVRSAVELASG